MAEDVRICLVIVNGKIFIHSFIYIFLLKQVVYGCNTADVDLLSTTNILVFVEKKYNFYNL